MKKLFFSRSIPSPFPRWLGCRSLSSTSSLIRDPLVGLNDQQKQLYIHASKFGEQYFAPNALKWDEKSEFPRLMMELCAQQGYGGWISSTEMGGRNWTKSEMVVVVEALANHCVSTTAMLTIHNACVSIIDKFSQSPHREEWVPKLCRMETMASFCLTEPGSGSDAASLITKATIDTLSNEYVINGEKCFISGAGMSDLYVVMCRTAPNAISAIVVPNGTPGLSFGSNEKKMGWKNQPTRQVKFEDVRVPFSHR
jgi:isobutyryl-CoA dehydrogenase